MKIDEVHVIDHGSGFRTLLPARAGTMKFSSVSAAQRCEMMVNDSSCTVATRRGRVVRWMPRSEWLRLRESDPTALLEVGA